MTTSGIRARDYHQALYNPHDHTQIAITVLQPALAAGEVAPLIVHSHGFGGARLPGRDRATVYEVLSGGSLPSAEAARRAAAAGYFVISFDQRGFGETGGTVRLMDPEVEGQDISAILDWAENEMPHRDHLAYRDGSPLIGALGLSYGGGFQLIGACVDPRFTALVPTATWYDLSYSIAPDNVVKTAWGTALVGLGVPTSGVDLDALLYRALFEGLVSPITGRGLSDSVSDALYNHSPASFYNGDTAVDGEKIADPQRDTPRVDALLIQGVGDTLFNLNEAVANARALRAAGNDVQLIGMQYGHSLPFLQDIDRIGYQTEAYLDWPDGQVETAALELAYLDWKLKGARPPPGLPRNTIVVDDETALVFDDIPIGASAPEYSVGFEGTASTGGLDLLLGLLREQTFDGLWQLLKGTLANAGDVVRRLLDPRAGGPRNQADTAALARLVNALPSDQFDELASGGVFIGLTSITHDDRAIAGIPTIDIDIAGDSRAPVVFAGIGVRRPGHATTFLLNKQVRPIRGVGERSVELNGVSARLAAGDEVGLMIYGYHPQYLASFSAIPGWVQVSGRIGLPLVNVNPAQAEHAE